MLAAWVLLAAPGLAVAQVSPQPERPEAPPGRHPPLVSLSFGAGSVFAERQGQGPSFAVGLTAGLHPHAAMEAAFGHYSAERILQSTGEVRPLENGVTLILGPYTLSDTWNVWYFSFSLLGRGEVGAARLWGGAGIVAGRDRGEWSSDYTTCYTVPSHPYECLRVLDLTVPHAFSTSLTITGGVEYPVGRRAAFFGSAGLLHRSPIFHAGLRVTLVPGAPSRRPGM